MSTYIQNVNNYYNINCLDYAGNVIWSKQTKGMILGGVVTNNTLFIAGRFTTADGMARREVAAFDASSGNLLPWDPGTSLPNIFSMAKLAVSNNELYLCYAPNVGRNVITTFNLTTGQPTGWSLSSAYFFSMIVNQGKMYASGNFIKDTNGTIYPNGLIIVDTQTKTILNNPVGITSGISCIAADGNTIYLSGANFTDPTTELSIGDAIAFDGTTQAILPFTASVLKSQNTSPSNSIALISAGGGNVYLGGSFAALNPLSRNNIFSYDVTTKDISSFAPDIDQQVTSLKATPSRLYVRGDFNFIDNNERLSQVASFDLTDGSLTNWDPLFDYPPTNLAGDDNTIYFYGSFGDIGGSSRNGLAAFDAATGNLNTWVPSVPILGAEGVVKSGSTVYVAAWTLASGNQLLFVDDATGAVQHTIPYGNGTLYDMAADNSNLYIGGNFSSVGGLPRTMLAAIDLASGTVNSNWNPVLKTSGGGGIPYVQKISAGGGSVYISGNFASVNNVPRIQIAALDAISGQPTDWSIALYSYNPFQEISSLYYTNNAVYIGGAFDWVNNVSSPDFASVSPDHSNVISGTVFYDTNGNGTKDAGENVAPNILIEIQPLNLFYPTDANGKYKAFTGTGSFTIKPVSPGYTTQVTPTSIPIGFASDLLLSNNNDFGIKVQPGVNDMSVVLTESTVARPGFDMNYNVDYENIGTLPESGQLTVSLDASITFKNSTPAPDVINGNNLIWNYTSLDPGYGNPIVLHLNIPVNLNLLGKELTTVATINPIAGDVDNTNNTSIIKQTVVGSFDPNDKEVTPQGQGDEGFIPPTTKSLLYTVRFQNTGTADAVNIHVKDQLDPNLNVSTFKMISSSHQYSNLRIDNRKVIWEFTNINLPDSTVSKIGSQGYVTYSIDLNDNLPEGTTIQNEADIYFDFNPAVATNVVTNTISSKTPQVIVFDPLQDVTFGDAPFILTATGGDSGNDVTFTSSDANVATVNSSNGIVHITIIGAGTVDITAYQVGDNTYLAANPVTRTLIVNQKDQTINNFGVLNNVLVGATPITLSATSSSGLPVTYSSSSANVAVNGNVVTILSAGTTTITASQAGNTNYKTVSATQPLTVLDSRIITATDNIDFGDHLVGEAPSVKSLTITNSGSGVLTITNITAPTGFTVDKTSSTIKAGESMALNISFTPLAAQDYAGAITITSNATSVSGATSVTGRGSLIAGIGDNTSDNAMAYPNPSKGIFTVQLKDSDGTGVLTDETGRMVTVQLQLINKDQYQLDLTGKEAGLYFLQCMSGKSKVVIKLVIQ